MKDVIGTYSPTVEKALATGFIVVFSILVCFFLYSLYRVLKGK